MTREQEILILIKSVKEQVFIYAKSFKENGYLSCYASFKSYVKILDDYLEELETLKTIK